MGSALEAGPALGALRLPVALTFSLFSSQAACFFYLVASHSGWSCGKGIYILMFPLSPCGDDMYRTNALRHQQS